MTTDLFGQVVVPVSRSQSRASKSASTIPATYGHNSNASSPSDCLQSYLESRLRARLTGSVSCEVIWKAWATPWGQSLWKPRARARTISEIVIGLWPTVTSNAPARDGYNEAGNSAGQVAIRKIILALWPTMTAVHRVRNSETLAKCAAFRKRNANQNTVPLYLAEVVIGLWSTIRSSDGAKGGPNQSFGAGGSPLPSQVSMVCSSSNAPTENGCGSLHPEFAGWEMGYPPEWLSCAPSETRSIRAQRRSS
jgi:hypothetical protein